MEKDEKIEDRKKYNAPFLRVFDYLAKEKMMNQGQFAKVIKGESGYISLLRSGVKRVGDDYIARIAAEFAKHFDDKQHLNPDYIDGKSPYMIIENVPDDDMLDKINRGANPDYDLMKQRKIQEKTQSPTLETSFVLEKVLSQAINEIKLAKDQTIAALEGQIEEKDKRIKLLEQKIEVLEAMQHIDADDPFQNYPFPTGVADDNKKDNMRV